MPPAVAQAPIVTSKRHCFRISLIRSTSWGVVILPSTSQYTANFNPWNDTGSTDGGNYAFQESAGVGVGGGGGVEVIQSSDTTATYRGGSWDFSTNGAALVLSTLVKANGLVSGDKVQLGIINTSDNGLNNNAGVAFESFRFIPQDSTTWGLFEQYRSNEALVQNSLGNISYLAGHWYKFVVGLTNVSGASGDCTAGCAIYDYGVDGLTPGTNIVSFPTLVSNPGQDIARTNAVWAALRAFQDGGIDGWDNFLVYTPASAPIITLELTNLTVALGQPANLAVLADGPGVISYAWYTNSVQVPGAPEPRPGTG